MEPPGATEAAGGSVRGSDGAAARLARGGGSHNDGGRRRDSGGGSRSDDGSAVRCRGRGGGSRLGSALSSLALSGSGGGTGRGSPARKIRLGCGAGLGASVHGATGDIGLGGSTATATVEGIADLTSVGVEPVDDLVGAGGVAVSFTVDGCGAGCEHQQRESSSESLDAHFGED